MRHVLLIYPFEEESEVGFVGFDGDTRMAEGGIGLGGVQCSVSKASSHENELSDVMREQYHSLGENFDVPEHLKKA